MVEVLNMPRTHKRAFRFCPWGEINFRRRAVALLDLHPGDSVMFCISDGQMYAYKDNSDPRALVVKGSREGQLRCWSVNTVRAVQASVSGITPELLSRPLELVVFNRRVPIVVDGVPHIAVNIINRI